MRRLLRAVEQLLLPLAGPDLSGAAAPPAPARDASPRPRAPRGRSRAGADGGAPAPEPAAETVFVRRRGARRYVLRVLDDGTLRVTLPWWGSKRDARAFVTSQRAWVDRQRAARLSRRRTAWGHGAAVPIEGVPQPLEVDRDGTAHLAGALVSRRGHDPVALRADVHRYLRDRAREALPVQLFALAERHGIAIARVSVRNQVSRWGSCSRHGSVALNWRLLQTPPWVCEYVLVHELMHRRELNHSPRFWRLVADACPRYLDARRWLRTEGAALFD